MLLWFQGPKEVKEDNRITFEQLEDEIVLVCRSAERPDEGNYNVTLRNNKGSDTANIRVIILDKPGAPEGPLEVSKITPESCTLKWNPPTVCCCCCCCKFIFISTFALMADVFGMCCATNYYYLQTHIAYL